MIPKCDMNREAEAVMPSAQPAADGFGRHGSHRSQNPEITWLETEIRDGVERLRSGGFENPEAVTAADQPCSGTGRELRIARSMCHPIPGSDRVSSDTEKLLDHVSQYGLNRP